MSPRLSVRADLPLFEMRACAATSASGRVVAVGKLATAGANEVWTGVACVVREWNRVQNGSRVVVPKSMVHGGGEELSADGERRASRGETPGACA